MEAQPLLQHVGMFFQLASVCCQEHIKAVGRFTRRRQHAWRTLTGKQQADQREPEGGAPYVAYGFDSVRTPYDTRTGERTKHRTTPYDKVRQSTAKYDNVRHRKTPYDTVRHRTARKTTYFFKKAKTPYKHTAAATPVYCHGPSRGGKRAGLFR